MSSFEDVVARFVNRAVPLAEESTYHTIASVFHQKINEVCTRTEYAHHRMRQQRGQAMGYKFAGKPPTDGHEYFPLQMFVDHISDHGFDIGKWCKTLRDHGQTLLTGFHQAHAQKLAANSTPRLQSDDSEALSEADTAVTSDSFGGGYGVDEKLAFEIQSIDPMSSFATNVTEAASAELILDAAEAASLVALGEVAIVALPIVLPLLISIFGSSGPGFQEALQVADAKHEQELRKLKEEIEKAEKEQDEYDKKIQQANEMDQLKRKRRRDDKKRKDDEDEEQKKREDLYFACIDRIVPLDFSSSLRDAADRPAANQEQHLSADPFEYGYELQVSAVREDGYWGVVFQGLIQEHEIGVDLLAWTGQHIYVITFYLHSLPPGMQVGSWIEFELNRVMTPADQSFVVRNSSFKDGTAVIEEFAPSGLTAEGSPMYFATSAWGANGSLKTATLKSAPENVLPILNRGINSFNQVSDAIHQGSRRLVRFIPPDRLATTLSSMLGAAASSSGVQARYLYMTNCGQGAAQFVASKDSELLFGLDCGYGRGKGAIVDNMLAVFKNLARGDCPMLLSHWDKDHYGIATSEIAKLSKFVCINRLWLAPKNVTGSLALQLYNQLDRANKLMIPVSSKLKEGNIQLRLCKRVAGTSAGKNNEGAIAVIFGSDTSGYMVYPGDANYECIHDYADFNKKTVIMVATHHGSIRSITHNSKIGADIPKAATGAKAKYTIDKVSTNGSICLLSYGAGNCYGHSTDRVAPYYKNGAGYKTIISTADSFNLTQGKLTAGKQDIYHEGILVGLQTGFQSDAESNVDTDSETAIRASDTSPVGLLASKPSTVPASAMEDIIQWQRLGSRTATPAWPETADLRGSDALSSYAIHDSHGMIVEYRVWAKTITLAPPLQVRCQADFNIPVVLQCTSLVIELPSNATNERKHTLVKFDVANGDTWTAPADLLTNGEPGSDAYKGAYLDLRVLQSWVIRCGQDVLFNSEASSPAPPKSEGLQFEIQYLNGRGGDGQAGGRGRTGENGVDGTDDTDGGSVRGVQATEGARGGDGCNGGAAGGPSTISRSRVTGLKSKTQFTTSTGETKPIFGLTLNVQDFGGAGNPGPGGKGGPGGIGGISGVTLDGDTIVSQNVKMDDGDFGRPGDQGSTWEGSLPDYQGFAPTLKLCETEDEMAQLFFETAVLVK